MAMWIKGSNNLFNETAFLSLDSVSEDIYNGENCYKLAPKGVDNKIPFKAKAGEKITLSMDISAPNGMDMYWFAETADGTGTNLGGIMVGADFETRTKTATLSTDIEYINIRCYAISKFTPYYIKNIMLNRGKTALPYEPYYPAQKVKAVFKSKNLLQFPSKEWYENRVYKHQGATYTVGKDGIFTITGTGTGDYGYFIFVYDENDEFLWNITAGTYTATLERIDGGVFNADEPCSFEIRPRAADGTILYGFREYSKNNIGKTKFSVTFNLADGEHIQRLAILHTGGYTYNMGVRVTLSKGTTAYSEPYFPLTKFKVIPKSRNLIPYPYYSMTYEANGLNITVNNDGTITINGECTGDTWFVIRHRNESGYLIDAGTYTLSGATNGILLYLTDNITQTTHYNWSNAPVTFTLNEKQVMYMQLKVFKGGSYNNQVIKPMLNKGATPLPYEPPQEIWK